MLTIEQKILAAKVYTRIDRIDKNLANISCNIEKLVVSLDKLIELKQKRGIDLSKLLENK